MTAVELIPEDGLRIYGVPLVSYRGTGQLTLSSSRVASCQFVAGQLENGKTLLLCATIDPLLDLRFGSSRPVCFEGVTSEGFSIRTARDLVETNYLPQTEGVQGTWLALRVSHVEISQPEPRHRKRLVYLLSNVAYVNQCIPFSLGGFNLTLRPLEVASRNMKRIEVLRSVLPTAGIEITTSVSVERVAEVVDEACYLLSLAFGTKVQWIALTEETGAHKWVRKHIYSRVTKRSVNSLYFILMESRVTFIKPEMAGSRVPENGPA